MTEMSMRLKRALNVHRKRLLESSKMFPSFRAMRLMLNMKGITVKVSATDKLTRILLEAVRRFGNLWNALNTKELPKMEATTTIALMLIKMIITLSVGPFGCSVGFAICFPWKEFPYSLFFILNIPLREQSLKKLLVEHGCRLEVVVYFHNGKIE